MNAVYLHYVKRKENIRRLFTNDTLTMPMYRTGIQMAGQWSPQKNILGLVKVTRGAVKLENKEKVTECLFYG